MTCERAGGRTGSAIQGLAVNVAMASASLDQPGKGLAYPCQLFGRNRILDDKNSDLPKGVNLGTGRGLHTEFSNPAEFKCMKSHAGGPRRMEWRSKRAYCTASQVAGHLARTVMNGLAECLPRAPAAFGQFLEYGQAMGYAACMLKVDRHAN